MLCARSRILMPERVHIAYEVRILRDQLFVKWLLSYAIKRHHKFRADSTVLLLTFLINCHQRSGLHLAKYLFPTFTLELHVKLRTDSLSPLLISLGSLSDALCFLGLTCPLLGVSNTLRIVTFGTPLDLSPRRLNPFILMPIRTEDSRIREHRFACGSHFFW